MFRLIISCDLNSLAVSCVTHTMACTLLSGPFAGKSTCCSSCHAASLCSSVVEQRSAWHVIHYEALSLSPPSPSSSSSSLPSFRLFNRFSLLGFKFLVSSFLCVHESEDKLQTWPPGLSILSFPPDELLLLLVFQMCVYTSFARRDAFQ